MYLFDKIRRCGHIGWELRISLRNMPFKKKNYFKICWLSIWTKWYTLYDTSERKGIHWFCVTLLSSSTTLLSKYLLSEIYRSLKADRAYLPLLQSDRYALSTSTETMVAHCTTHCSLSYHWPSNIVNDRRRALVMDSVMDWGSVSP